MKPCVLYISRTGNTKRLAEAIADQLKAPVFEITTIDPAVANNYDLLIIGTPVMGMGPAPEVSNFIKQLPNGNGKSVIIFCTYAFAKGSILKTMENQLSVKNYRTILGVGKRGIKPGKSDFDDVLREIAKVVKV